jgi:hypothetical protein
MPTSPICHQKELSLFMKRSKHLKETPIVISEELKVGEGEGVVWAFIPRERNML